MTVNNETAPLRYTLGKGEKLRHKSLVDALFREGKTLYDFPLRLSWRIISEEGLQATFRSFVPANIDCVQMLITVPKKKRRHAVDRVLMRRRIREAYRLNRFSLKNQIKELPGIGTLSMAIIYLSDKNEDYSTIEHKLKLLLKRVENTVRKQSAHQKGEGVCES